MNRISRRNVLIGGAAMASAPYLMNVGAKQASAQGVSRIRREIHGLVAADGTPAPDLVVYMDAITETKKTSPLLWDKVTNFHDAFCATGAGSKEVHWNWRFIMWHRAYLATYERILQEHSDKIVSLPYWNWFNSDGLPSAFTMGPLNHPGRKFGEGSEGPGSPQRPIVNGDRGRNGEISNYDTRNAYHPGQSFFGGDYDPLNRRAGMPEGQGHAGIHNWVGGDMASLNTSSLDPCFYSHHSNVDRMLELWKINRAPEDWFVSAPTAWKDQIFEFAFDNDRIYRYRAADMVDTSRIVDVDGEELGFIYDEVPEIETDDPFSGLVALSQSSIADSALTRIEMQVSPPSQSFSLGGLEVSSGQGATSAFELSETARNITDSFIADSSGDKLSDFQSFSFSRTAPPTARLVLRDIVLPGKNSQVNFFINVEEPDFDTLREGSRYLGTINTIPTDAETVTYEEYSFEASNEILDVLRSEDRIFVSSFTRYLDDGDVVQIGEVELVIE